MRGLTASVEEAESELTVVGYKLVVSKEHLPRCHGVHGSTRCRDVQ